MARSGEGRVDGALRLLRPKLTREAGPSKPPAPPAAAAAAAAGGQVCISGSGALLQWRWLEQGTGSRTIDELRRCWFGSMWRRSRHSGGIWGKCTAVGGIGGNPSRVYRGNFGACRGEDWRVPQIMRALAKKNLTG